MIKLRQFGLVLCCFIIFAALTMRQTVEVTNLWKVIGYEQRISQQIGLVLPWVALISWFFMRFQLVFNQDYLVRLLRYQSIFKLWLKLNLLILKVSGLYGLSYISVMISLYGLYFKTIIPIKLNQLIVLLGMVIVAYLIGVMQLWLSFVTDTRTAFFVQLVYAVVALSMGSWAYNGQPQVIYWQLLAWPQWLSTGRLLALQASGSAIGSTFILLTLVLAGGLSWQLLRTDWLG